MIRFGRGYVPAVGFFIGTIISSLLNTNRLWPLNDGGLLPSRQELQIELCQCSDKARKKASLDYTIIKTLDNYFCLEINLHTGRHHQIRAQLSAIGCPIKGDLKYGFDRSNPDGGIHLHARKLVFIHPVSKESLEIMADPPKDAIWNAV